MVFSQAISIVALSLVKLPTEIVSDSTALFKATGSTLTKTATLLASQTSGVPQLSVSV